MDASPASAVRRILHAGLNRKSSQTIVDAAPRDCPDPRCIRPTAVRHPFLETNPRGVKPSPYLGKNAGNSPSGLHQAGAG